MAVRATGIARLVFELVHKIAVVELFIFYILNACPPGYHPTTVVHLLLTRWCVCYEYRMSYVVITCHEQLVKTVAKIQ